MILIGKEEIDEAGAVVANFERPSHSNNKKSTCLISEWSRDSIAVRLYKLPKLAEKEKVSVV